MPCSGCAPACQNSWGGGQRPDAQARWDPLGAVVLSACQLLVAAVQLAIALAVAGAPMPQVTAESVTALVVLGVVGTGFAYVLAGVALTRRRQKGKQVAEA